MVDTVASCLARAVVLQPVSDSARLDTELLLCHVLDKTRTWLFTWPEKELSPAQVQAFEGLLARRERGEPVAHILGEKEFWSLPLYVDASTLIPRPDTELLVETVLDLPGSKASILDLGTGTGAIALALASELPQARVVAVDKSSAAVALAQRNQARLQINNITILQSDWFAGVPSQTFDVIVSNPPYIDANDLHLQQGDVRFEPASALVAAENGMADLHEIIRAARSALNPGGALLLEHGWQQAGAVRDLLARHGYEETTTVRDISGHERVTYALMR